ncbi:MAG: stage II sporulation protein R [Bacteroides sp.]|nr:stage II sporulation protein R [Bacillota bacterium]MCM1394069.1 stage II sporulation protein R [[Eubacterium] siraeum]MCM1455861.1 stage II sporulation protein R [Bacteroides sp.]
MKTGKTIITSFIALLLLAVAIMTMSACNLKSADQKQLAEACIRIHIRANSNSAADQSVKLLVRDAITGYLENALADCKTKSEANDVLSGNRTKLTAIANSTLRENGFSYASSIRIGNEYFPDRVYDGYDFPAGNYDAVVINLGSGAGDNWWCVAFPPLCFVPDSDNGEKIEYKSWVKEMLDKLFN